MNAPSYAIEQAFWSGKRVFVTGHTGFKGSWLTLWLNRLGAVVGGYALPPLTTPNLFTSVGIDELCESTICDIRDLSALHKAMMAFKPEIVIHMAAQPIVRESYMEPADTFEVNVQGTVNVLEASRRVAGVRSVIIVTTDKCYEDKGLDRGYRETDRLGGRDPYSASKACAELVTSSYRSSFFNSENYSDHGVAVASARAGNVFGGGDWSKDRLIPDAAKAFGAGKKVKVRNPDSLRPWQHVLEPLSGYLSLARATFEDGAAFATGWNFGPHEDQLMTVRDIIEDFSRTWGEKAEWYSEVDSGQVHEAATLHLDSSLARSKLGWDQRMDINEAISQTANWYKAFYAGSPREELRALCNKAIDCFQVTPNRQS